MYGNNPRNASELRILDKGKKSNIEANDFIKHLKSMHEEVHQHINKMNT